MKTNCLHCGKEIYVEVPNIILPARANGKTLTRIYLQVRYQCCSDECAKAEWLELYKKAQKMMYNQGEKEC